MALVMRTRGAHAWVRKMPTGLPDWTSSVSSFSRRLQGGDDGVEGLPVAGRLAGAAVDHEVLGALGDLGVEVVHEHAQGRLLLPALAGELRAAGGTNHAGPLRTHDWRIDCFTVASSLSIVIASRADTGGRRPVQLRDPRNRLNNRKLR